MQTLKKTNVPTKTGVISKYALFDHWRSGTHIENFDQQLPAKQTDLESICHVSRCFDLPVSTFKTDYTK